MQHEYHQFFALRSGLGDAGRHHFVQIQAGRAQDGMIEAVSGLAAGDKVVTSGSLFIDRAAQGD